MNNTHISTEVMTTSLQFNNQSILAVQKDNIAFVAIKPICENIGLAWNAQQERIARDEVLNSTVRVIRMVAKDGKNREMLCLPIQYLNGWLFGIDVKRVKPEIKNTLITYKKECYRALHDYFHKGLAVNPRLSTVTDRKGLGRAVNRLAAQTNLTYKDVWVMVNEYMGTHHVDELTCEQIPQAVAYVHKLLLDSDKPKLDKNTQINIIACASQSQWCYAWFEQIAPAIRMLNPKLYSSAVDHFISAKSSGRSVLSALDKQVSPEKLTKYKRGLLS